MAPRPHSCLKILKFSTFPLTGFLYQIQGQICANAIKVFKKLPLKTKPVGLKHFQHHSQINPELESVL